MSTQPNPGIRLTPELPNGDLVFGDSPQSSLTIPKALLAKISEHVNEGVRKLSPGGLEVGGLLLGPKVRGGRVVVAGIIPLPIEYRFGPSFQMSVFDLPSIAAAIESVQSDPSNTVVGFYRSRRRDSRILRESDHDIFAAVEEAHKSFKEDFRCCLILAPTTESEALACIAMRNGNAWDEMQPYTVGLNPPSITSFPASTVLQHLTRDTHAQEQPASVAVSKVQPVIVPQNTAPAELPAANRSGIRRVRIGMYVLAGILTIWTAGLYFFGGKEPSRSFPAAPANAAPRLGFSATFESPVWRLSWNRAAMDDLKPVGAILSIQDGAIQQEVPFTPADLSSGTIFYTPQGGDLNFGLRVDRGGTFVEEHVRVLGAPGAAQKQTDRAPQPVATKTAAVVAPPAPNKQLPAAAPNSLPNNVAVAAPSASAKPEPISVPPAVPATTLSKENAKASENAKEPQPESEVKSLPAPVLQQTVMAIATPVPPAMDPPRVVAPPPTPSTKSVAQPTKQEVQQPPAAPPAVPSANPVSSTAAAPAPAKATYVGPKPIQQVSPQMPPSSLPDVSQVQVLVDIDVRGKVTKVTPIAWNARNAPMMGAAVRAASSWVFAPAQLNDHAVPSQMTLTFRVNPPAR